MVRSERRRLAALAAQLRAAREADDTLVLEGLHAVKHALRFGARIRLAIVAERSKVVTLARELAPDLVAWFATVPEEVGAEAFGRLWPKPPETGVLALAARPRPQLADLAPGRPVVLLERPAHLGNVGAVVRVAAAAAAAGVLTTGPYDPWHPTALRTAAGLHFALPVIRLEAELPALGRRLLALDPAGAPLDPRRIPPDAVFAFGSERRGLSPGLRQRADGIFALPMRPGVSSLNLATAVAATLYAVRLCTLLRDDAATS